MKRFISVAVIILFLATLAIYEGVAVANVIETLRADITNIENNINEENLQAVLPKIEKGKENWSKSENNLCLIFSHKDLSMINDSYTKLIVYTKNNDYENVMLELALLKDYSEKTPHIMGINIQNIL